jgi:hypothetical protein
MKRNTSRGRVIRSRSPRYSPCPGGCGGHVYYKAMEMFGQCLNCAVRKGVTTPDSEMPSRNILILDTAGLA